MRKNMAELMYKLSKNEGVTDTLLEGVKIYRCSKPIARTPLIYKNGVIIVGQGYKRIHLGEKTFEYNPENYLVLPLPLPAECETFAEDGKPMLSILLDIDLYLLSEINNEINNEINEIPKKCTGVYLNCADDEFKDAVCRLLEILQSPNECRILGRGIIKELIYRIVCKNQTASITALTMHNSNLWKLDKALKFIHNNFPYKIEVEKLAQLVHMSTSTFHRSFKTITTLSPIQYLKKVRLNNAKSLIIEKGYLVNEAAIKSGYESITQFSREFKEYFGQKPSQIKKENSQIQNS
ncbi:MAG: AraC family transcriptional regulator [Lentisphaeria bacterium]